MQFLTLGLLHNYVYEDLDSGFTLTPGHFLATNRNLDFVILVMLTIIVMKISNLTRIL